MKKYYFSPYSILKNQLPTGILFPETDFLTNVYVITTH